MLEANFGKKDDFQASDVIYCYSFHGKQDSLKDTVDAVVAHAPVSGIKTWKSSA